RHTINDTGAYLNVVFAADVDNDGDMDILSASPGDNEVAWYENMDGLGNFGPKNSITNTLENAWTVYAADLDNDGDIDVLATLVQTFGGEVVWFENLDGLGSFSTKKIISTEVQSPRSVIAADIDNDGDMDVISSSQNDDKIAWYENLTIIGIKENQLDSIKIYPNPTKGLVFINPRTETIVSATIFDVLGKKVLQQNRNIQELNISSLQSGMYFLRVTTDSGELVKKIIKE
ncbi:MAG TPA: T9SS type A sorting domain-containing protein, partial [Aequorivita sp.]|nr:T9SS type A sorting domain-containing protein [Aequorivita sp.]